jgi:hypothetical protein
LRIVPLVAPRRAVHDAGREDTTMTLEYNVRIESTIHRVRVAVPIQADERNPRRLKAVEHFAISTAYLEHYGYLPRNVVNAVD